MPPLWPWRRSLAAIGLDLPRQNGRAVAGPAGRELMAAAIVEGVAAAAARQPLLIGRQHAADHGVADRVDLEVVDLADEWADWSPRYDLVLFIECVHDFPRPVEALRHARAAVRPGGTVLVVDERAAENFTAPGDETERFFAAASAIWCLPQGRVGPDPEPVGTLIRPAAMRDLARRAGYTDAEILPIEHPVWRFYRLVP